MAELKRSRLGKKNEDEITKKTIFLGLATIVVFVVLVVFGLPFLIKFSVILGDLKKSGGEIKEKVLPPMSPRIILPYDATNSAVININGLAEKGTTVELLKNEVSIGKSAVNENGEFVFSDISFDEGESAFAAIAISESGNSSEQSKEVKIVFDNKPPELTLTNPTEDTLKVESPDFDVIGQSERGVTVMVNGRLAMVDDSGLFKIKLQLNTGKNDIEIKVKDSAGNETVKRLIVTNQL
jgi:hypothetical protein